MSGSLRLISSYAEIVIIVAGKYIKIVYKFPQNSARKIESTFLVYFYFTKDRRQKSCGRRLSHNVKLLSGNENDLGGMHVMAWILTGTEFSLFYV